MADERTTADPRPAAAWPLARTRPANRKKNQEMTHPYFTALLKSAI